MMKLNLNKEAVGKIAKGSFSVISFVAMGILSNLSADDVKSIVRRGKVTYDDAVGAIMDSNLFNADKRRASDLLPHDGEIEMYKAVIQVVKSNLFSEEKVQTIESICERWNS